MSALSLAVRGLAKLYPADVDPSDEMGDSLRFIESRFDPETVMRAGYGAAFVSLLPAAAVLLTPVPGYVAALLLLVLPVTTIFAVQNLPHFLAALRRTEALGSAPTLMGLAVLRMEIQPTTETAVDFAAETTDGPLSDSLAAHVDRSLGSPKTGLISFADEWTEYFPALRRSAHLFVTAQDAVESERARTLERALEAILDGTREQMAQFTSDIRGPTTGLYAFGILLPMALIALVPAGALAGYPISIWFFVVVYNLLLPLGLIFASAWLLANRPVAFPPPDVAMDHPDLPDDLRLRSLAGVAGGAAFAGFVYLLGPRYLAAVAGIGFGLGISLLAVFEPVKEVRDYVRDVEKHLVDALYLVGRQVSEGESVESAIALAADRVPAETGAVFETAAGLQRRLHVGVEEAFLGQYGALRDVPSSRAHSTATLLSIAATEGQPAGSAIVSMGEHLEELQDVEAETRRQLEVVTSTLEHTAAFFGPLIAGATVGLAGMMADEGADQMEATPLPPDQLGIVVGVFIISLSLILTPLSIALRHGVDRALIGYYVGRSLVLAMPLYVVTIMLVGMIG